MTSWHAEWAWLGGEEAVAGVLLEAEGPVLTRVTAEVGRPPAGAVRLAGLTMPGLFNGHSHVFHRALRARTQSGAGTFRSWRDRMYDLALRLDPDTLFRLARATFAEMLVSGITAVCEFHYLHHPDGMDDAVIAAAADAGIAMTFLDTCYLRAGFAGEPLAPAQERFSDGSAAGWRDRATALEARHAGARFGVAVHSVRAVDPETIARLARWAAERQAELHVHVSEQRPENDACRLATGRTPTRLLADCGALGPRTTAVHATHVSSEDVSLLGGTGTRVCLCPTTERDLADGVGPAGALVEAGSPLVLGTDSQAVVDLFAEARATELDERLVRRRRGLLQPRALLAAAVGHRSLAPGEPADLVTVAVDTPRTAGFRPPTAAGTAVFAATAADVREVVVAGRHVVQAGRHTTIDAGFELSCALAQL